MATLEQIIEEARALSPAEKGKLRQALDRELEQQAPVQSRAEESAWIDRHRDEYLGQWVAIERDTLIAHGTTLVKFIWWRARPESTRPLLSAWKSGKMLSWEAGSDLRLQL